MTHLNVDLKSQPIQLPSAFVSLLEKKNAGTLTATGNGQANNHMMPQIQIHNHMGAGDMNSTPTVSSTSGPIIAGGEKARLHLAHDSYPSISDFLLDLQKQGGAHNFLQYEETLLEMGGSTISLVLDGIRDCAQMRLQSLGAAFIALLAENPTSSVLPPPIFIATAFCRKLETAALEYELRQNL